MHKIAGDDKSNSVTMESLDLLNRVTQPRQRIYACWKIRAALDKMKVGYPHKLGHPCISLS